MASRMRVLSSLRQLLIRARRRFSMMGLLLRLVSLALRRCTPMGPPPTSGAGDVEAAAAAAEAAEPGGGVGAGVTTHGAAPGPAVGPPVTITALPCNNTSTAARTTRSVGHTREARNKHASRLSSPVVITRK